MKSILLPFLAMIAVLAAAPAAPSDSVAPHVHAEFTHGFTVARPLADAFVFFEPIGEKKWAEGWAPVFASPVDARLHNGSVFTVDRPSPHGSPAISSVWTITQYEPPRTIEYHNVLIGVRATRITVNCEALNATETRVTVRYVYTGLTEAGDKAIAQITEASYREMIESWSKSIADYLQRGTPASP